ncbi:DUF1656 domain-containing protein [Vibrio mexicanus]|uniref:DUF1656 domain-containing protein n=1 Tax=Vibrio mexicanus TaxID=1004326 RepID=UPI00094966B6|nr:DUF1656 domain-containing protein [Vibrio mexicanus]
MPHEFTLGEVYLPPFLVVAFIAYMATNLISAVAAKTGTYRFIAAPAIFELSVFVLLCCALSLLLPIV